MDLPEPPIKPVKTFRDHVRAGLARSARDRPASFYLLLGMVVVILLGGQVVYVKDDPKQFALFLSLYFLFFFVLIFRAILDSFDIARAHFRRSEGLLSEVFEEDGFAVQLGRSVAQNKKKS